ncbi:unnamed protein product [Gadus morhua 'NCC']
MTSRGHIPTGTTDHRGPKPPRNHGPPGTMDPHGPKPPRNYGPPGAKAPQEPRTTRGQSPPGTVDPQEPWTPAWTKRPPKGPETTKDLEQKDRAVGFRSPHLTPQEYTNHSLGLEFLSVLARYLISNTTSDLPSTTWHPPNQKEIQTVNF